MLIILSNQKFHLAHQHCNHNILDPLRAFLGVTRNEIASKQGCQQTSKARR